jgi:hypothetical protein
MIDDLAAFIAARLDEDAEFIDDFTQPAAMQERRANRQPMHVGGFSDQRMLREVEAKRAILADCVRMIGPQRKLGRYTAPGAPYDAPAANLAFRTLRSLASAYDTHPDHRQEWRS